MTDKKFNLEKLQKAQAILNMKGDPEAAYKLFCAERAQKILNLKSNIERKM